MDQGVLQASRVDQDALQASRVDQSALQASRVDKGALEDIETLDLFAASPGDGEELEEIKILSESDTQMVDNVLKTPHTRRISLPVKRDNPAPSTTKKSSPSFYQ